MAGYSGRLELPAMCPYCGDSILYGGSIEECPSCAMPLAESDLLADEDTYCDDCNGLLYWYEQRCQHCHKPCSSVFWQEIETQLSAEWNDQLIDHIIEDIADESVHLTDDQKESLASSVISIAFLHNLCCDNHWENCHCDPCLAWEDVYGLPREITEEVYEYQSACSSCEFFYTAACLPYRSWLIDFFDTGEIPGAIDICSNYLLDPLCKEG